MLHRTCKRLFCGVLRKPISELEGDYESRCGCLMKTSSETSVPLPDGCLRTVTWTTRRRIMPGFGGSRDSCSLCTALGVSCLRSLTGEVHPKSKGGLPA